MRIIGNTYFLYVGYNSYAIIVLKTFNICIYIYIYIYIYMCVCVYNIYIVL